MSLLAQSSRYAQHCISRIQPIASSSRQVYYPAIRSSAFVRSAHALARPTESGFEGVPAPAYNGTIEDAKGKHKEDMHAATKPPPRRKMEIKSKKAAISMVSQHQGLGEIDAQSDNQTPAALDRLRALVASPTEPKLLRIGVKTRGCAGMAYHLDYVPPPGGRFDEVVEQDGVRVLIDSKALFSIIGSTMDWRDNRLSAGFVFDK
jgi:iron-sulfur cluster assembly accessory protein